MAHKEDLEPSIGDMRTKSRSHEYMQVTDNKRIVTHAVWCRQKSWTVELDILNLYLLLIIA